MTIFTSISQGKIKIVTCFTRQKKLYSLFFLRRTKHVTISSFPWEVPAKMVITRLKHVMTAGRATGNARFRSHMGLKPWKIVRI